MSCEEQSSSYSNKYITNIDYLVFEISLRVGSIEWGILVYIKIILLLSDHHDLYVRNWIRSSWPYFLLEIRYTTPRWLWCHYFCWVFPELVHSILKLILVESKKFPKKKCMYRTHEISDAWVHAKRTYSKLVNLHILKAKRVHFSHTACCFKPLTKS